MGHVFIDASYPEKLDEFSYHLNPLGLSLHFGRMDDDAVNQGASQLKPLWIVSGNQSAR